MFSTSYKACRDAWRRWPALGVLAWPSSCTVCRAAALNGLCQPCLARFAAPSLRCTRCALRAPSATVENPVCGACQQHQPPQANAVAALDYAFPWTTLITGLKFHGQAATARTLAPLLLRASLRLPPPDWVLPMPLAPQRLAERGYNQAWELARHVAAARNLPTHAGLLQRPVDSPHQVALNRAQRVANLRAAFYVPPPLQPLLQGRRVALVDDVMTTGATAHEATRTLMRAGAAAVDLWMLARTPEPGS